MSSDAERQRDEIFALKNIYDTGQFRSIQKDNIECSFSINCQLMKEYLFIKHPEPNKQSLSIQYLPPIRLYVKLPLDYPSRNAPKYSLAINWLPPWEISLICQKLDEIWLKNNNNEILYNWTHFLKNELLNYLNISDFLDVTFLYKLYTNPEDKLLQEVVSLSDHRILYGSLYLNPIEILFEENKEGELLEFNTSYHECEICFVAYLGNMCTKITQCCHIFCKNCILQYLKLKIVEKNVQFIMCPAFNCKIIIEFNQIKEICPENLFDCYEKNLMESKLMQSNNLVYCPRKICQKPVIVQSGENLASCINCQYNFCAYCFKVYHGVMPCDINLEQKKKMIQEYSEADSKTKKYLEKKYGKNQIKQVVEKQLTDDYLKENTKICPTCNMYATKISGCNLITCLKCHTNYCWICNWKIVSDDPYDHFKSSEKNQCSGRLFEGVDDQDEFENLLNLNLNIEDLILINELMDEA